MPSRPDAQTALREARVALESVSTDEDKEGVAIDNNAFSSLINAVLALKRVSDEDTDEYRVLDNLHEEITETYTDISGREDGTVDADIRIEYYESLYTLCERLETQCDIAPEYEE